jgi:hypothetical protein
MTSRTRRRLAFVAGFGLYFAALWYLWYTPVVYPLKIFVVLLHEVSHAVALVATGGTLDRITLEAAQGGATWGRGGIRFITLSAGYLGSLGLGALLVLGGQSRRVSSRLLLAGVGGVILALTLGYVRGGFGVAFGLLFGAGLVLAGRRLPERWSSTVLMALGLTSVCYAILDIKSDILDRPGLRSDARMLSELTGIPTLAWGVLWIAVAVAAAAWLVRRAYRNA